MTCLISNSHIFFRKKKKNIAPGHLLAFLQHIAAQFLKKSHPRSGAKVQNVLSASTAWRGSSPGGPRFHISTTPFRCTKMRSKKMNELSPPKKGTNFKARNGLSSNFEPTHVFRRIICYHSGDEYSTVIFFS